MKKIFFALLLFMTTVAVAQVSVLQTNGQQLLLEITTPQLSVSSLQIDGITFSHIAMDNFDGGRQVGDPNLPTCWQLVEAPLCAGAKVKIEDATFDTVDGADLGLHNPIVPVQPSRSKSDTLPAVLVQNAEIYSTNTFYGANLLSAEPVGIARDKNLYSIAISPFRYNPVTNQLIVCRSARVRITFVNSDMEATQQMKQRYASPAFTIGQPLLAELPAPKAVSTSAPVRMLIVSHSSFRGQLDEFIRWKHRTGFLTDIVYTDSIGTTSTGIKNYIVSQYNNATADRPAPTYLILVGDVAQIPAFSSNSTISRDHVTDLYYACWTLGDNIPDCYYGRFSAQNLAQLTPQIEKTLMYEQYTFPDPSFLDHAVLVAGQDQGRSGDKGYTHADPTMVYIATHYVNGDYGYSQVKLYMNNTGLNPNKSNVSVAYNDQASTVASQYNAGAGWINYSAHGDWDRWYKPAFTVSNVNNMTNTKKFGIMIGNCCLSGKFDEQTCLGEALLRKDGFRGAAAYVGASNSSYWNEDVYWSMGVRSSIKPNMSMAYNSSHLGMYDRLFHTHNEPLSDQYTSMGGVIMAGNMAVQASSSSPSFKLYYWEIYHLFGDPSLSPWLCRAKDMVLSYDSIIAQNGERFEVVAVPGAYVALTTNDDQSTLITASFASNSGTATLSYPNDIPKGVYRLAVSAQNYKTSFHTIRVADEGLNLARAHVFPNPVTNTAVVECDTIIKRLAVYDIMGNRLSEIEVNAHRAAIDFSNYRPGGYILLLETPAGIISRQTIKRKSE